MHEVVEGFDDLSALNKAEQPHLLHALHESKSLLDTFFASSPAGLAILEPDLRFERVNDTFAAIAGIPAQDHPGKTLREIIPGLADQVEPCLKNFLLTGRNILNCEVCGSPVGDEGVARHWIASYLPVPGEHGEISRIGCVLLDISECRRAEASLRHLSGRLMELQDQERRRIARELHDSIGQCLTAIKLNLDILNRNLPKSDLDIRSAKVLAEALTLSEQCSSDTRTISYLLHPPLLDERGLASAIRWYADGFAQRSGIHLSIHLPGEEARLPQAVETTLFRIVQESLTNIHRHSGSSRAYISLLVDAESATLQVRDEGRGIPPARLRSCNRSDPTVGVGISGMRERVRQFGGQLTIASDSTGTLLRADIPLGGAA